jgi:hypothetical protein
MLYTRNGALITRLNTQHAKKKTLSTLIYLYKLLLVCYTNCHITLHSPTTYTTRTNNMLLPLFLFLHLTSSTIHSF